jgi:hypothetical protein
LHDWVRGGAVSDTFYEAGDAEFLMSLVEDSFETDPPTDGAGSYAIVIDESTGVPTLSVVFSADDGVDLVGKWRLSLVSIVKTGGDEDE